MPGFGGKLFLSRMAERYGEEALATFVEEVAGQWIPFRLNAAAQKAFGVSFSEGWSVWVCPLAIANR